MLVIDNFVRQPDELVKLAALKLFVESDRFFPGIRAKAPLSYRQFAIRQLQDSLLQFFQLDGRSIKFTMCHYSLLTTPREELVMAQRIPHIDSVSRKGLAAVHYLFKSNYGGTAFYRHRKTGFEYVDEARKNVYFQSLDEEINGPCMPGPEYINGDTSLFEQIAKQDGVFNRILIYRRNSLHSGCIDKDFVPDPDPLTGRLSINSFIDVEP